MRRVLLATLALFVGCGSDTLSGVGRDAGASDAPMGTTIDTGVIAPRMDAAAPDALESEDAAPLDVGAMDASFPDAALPDAVATDAAAPDATAPVDAGGCRFDVEGPEDKRRVVLIGQPFTDTPGVNGTEIRTMVLPPMGPLSDVGVRLDVGFRPARIEFVPSGEYAIVLGEDGDLASVRVIDERQVSVVDRLALPRGGFGDLHILDDGHTIFALNEDVGATSGVYTLRVGCDGRLTHDAAAFHNLRLMSSLAFAGAQDRAVVLGGQAVFAPVDPSDLRLFSRSNGRWTETATFDLWTDHVDALRIAVSPDGRTLIVPNGSPFSAQGNTVMVANVDATSIYGPRLVMNMDDAREAIFSPDGQTALVTLLTPGRVVVFSDLGMGFAETNRINGVGLAEQMAMVRRGPISGRVILPSVDPAAGPNVASLQIDGPGIVSDLGQVPLGMNSADIPGAVAVMR